MTKAAIAAAIRSRFDAQCKTALDVPIGYDNYSPDENPTEPWARFSVLFGETAQADCAPVGERRFRTTGMAVCELFYPVGVGDAAALAAADIVVAAFRGVSISPSITFDSPSLTAGFRDGPWWKRNVNIPFRADETA